MALQNLTIQGGVLINHTLQEGKHQYEVEKVMKHRPAKGEKMFVRKGDKLMLVNDIDLQNLPPEDLAQILSQGQPMLTLHKTSENKDKERPPEDGNLLRPFFKESVLLSIRMEMRREGEEEVGEEEEETDGCTGEGAVVTEGGADGEKKEMIVVTMTKTSISVVTGRSCGPDDPCQGCQGRSCTYNNVVIVSETSTVTVVPRGGSSFKEVNFVKASIEHVATHQYLRGLCSQKTLYASPNPENITIYHYKSNIVESPFRGVPVVLNFTDSNCFLRCFKEGPKVVLQVEEFEKRRLKQICLKDDTKLSFVFYMKSDHSRHTSFESVLHRGWFIQFVSSGPVSVEALDGASDRHAFLFVIRKDSVTVR